ncbi:SpaA isopeptide-forming pilin-related protein [Proteiniclasticum sp.]|uniref:SpaA isopeptide-forming pilin-related protein n=1 Tax=Proteiniclasticum sp. TaxID=2053595 RepID=UPI00289B8F56|nr:SpaA isopeptide-forming pilin-related protein [Proteiniclasticum sp.]
MKLVTRKLCAVFLTAVMLLQFVFTIPVSVFADAGTVHKGIVVESILLLQENGEDAMEIKSGEALVLQIDWSHSSDGELSADETIISLPEELMIEAGEMKITDGLGIPSGRIELKGNEIKLIIDPSVVGKEGSLEVVLSVGVIPAGNHTFQISIDDTIKTIDVIIQEDEKLETEEIEISEEKNGENDTDIVNEGLGVEVPKGSIGLNDMQLEGSMALGMFSEVGLDQFKFNNIYFLDNDYDPLMHDIEDYIYSADKPYDLNVPNNYGLLYFDFDLIDGHDVKAYDTFTFKLPEELKPVSGIMGELGSIGQWFVQLDGTVRFEFGEGVNGDDVRGYFWFSVKLDESEMDDTIIQEIRFEVYPDFEMRFPVKPKGGSLLNKNGTINNNGYNSSEAYWSIDLNTSLDKLDNTSVKDVIPVNMILKKDSLIVYRLDVTSGGIRSEGEVLEGNRYELSIDESGNPTILFNGLTEEEKSAAYRIKYTTEIVEPSEGFDGTQTFKNNVVLISGGKSYTSASTVSSGYGKALDKLNPSYDWSRQEFQWTINYNFNEKYIDSDEAFLTDTWTANNNVEMKFQLSEFEIYPVAMNQSGNAIVSDTPIDSSLYNLVGGSTGFILNFTNDIDRQAYQIRYKTRILGSQGSGIVDGSGSLTNKVETGTGKEDGSSGSWTQRGIIKSSTGTDVNKKEIGWRVLLNQNSYLMENLVVTDTFTGDGLTLLEDTLIITGKEKTYLLGTDYVLVYTAPVPGVSSGGFVISFNGSVNEPVTLTYTTHFERNSGGTASYVNKAKISWNEGDKEYSSESGSITVRPAGYTGPNGVKNGNYNARDKEITWSIHTNYARLPIEDGYKISDSIPQNQELVEEYLEVFSYNVDNRGNITGEALLDEDSYTVVYPEADNGYKLEVSLLNPHIGEKTSVGIRFKTRFLNGWIQDPKVKNTAEFTNGKNSFKLEATVTIPYGGEYVHKSGIQTGFYNERVDWTVYINRSQSLIKEYTLKDNPDLNSVLLEDTFKLYRAVVQTNGAVTKSTDFLVEGTDYSLVINTDNETGKQDFVLSFVYDIDDPYILEYSSYIDPLVGKGEAITNAYTAEGITSEEITDGDTSSEVKNVNSGGAGGTSIRGGLIIRKTDESNPQAVLEGALFNLYTKDGKQLLRTGITDTEGVVRFGGLRRGEYLLKEIQAPKRYVISKPLAEGIIVTLNHSSQDEFKLFDYANSLSKISLRKIDESGKVISAEAVFNLYAEDGTLIRQDLKTVNGLLSVFDLDEGKYYVKETKSPEGFILNPEKFTFEIRINEDGTQSVPTVNVVNYKGKAEFVKVNEQGEYLPGAVFHLYSGEERVRTNLVADERGAVVIDNLAPGTYQVREISAPEGYLLNTEEIQFTIPESVLGKPQTFKLKQFMNYEGMVRLFKADEKGNPLEGAQFKIVDDQNNNVKTGMTTGEDGRVYASGLAPGKYSFIETKAPSGYILEPTPIDFEIGTSAEGMPVIVTAGHKENYKGSAVLKKMGENGNLLPGAVFDLYEIISGDQVQRILEGAYTTNFKGEIRVTELSPGNYEFVEKTAPVGYIRNTEPIKFIIVSETVGKPEIVNAGDAINYKGSAVMVKTDSKGNPLNGAAFEVITQEGETVRTGLISDEEGRVTVTELVPGRYSFKEVGSAEGYILNQEPLNFVIENESEGKPEIVEAGNLINYKGSVELTKKDKDAHPLEGALFTLYTEKDEAVAENLKSDENGKVFVDELSSGNYYFLEEKAPEGYIKNTEKIAFTISEFAEGKPEQVTVEAVNYKGSVMFVKVSESGDKLEGAEFELKEKETELVIVEGLKTDENGTILVSGLVPGEYTFVEVKAPIGFVTNNEPMHFTVDTEYRGEPAVVIAGEFKNYKGTAVLEKVDANGNPLEGAIFELQDEEGNLILTDLRSDDEGKVIALNLSPGIYRFAEKHAPEGYLVNLMVKTFEINEEAYGEPLAVEAGNLINYKGKAVLMKTDESGNPLKDAQFRVTDKYGKIVIEGLYSDENGMVSAEELNPGEYFFEEIKAPEGFIRNLEKAAFAILDMSHGEPEIIDAGSYINYKGSAEWFKVNESGEAMQGARFNLTDEEGNIVYKDLISDDTGKVMVENLAPGEYTIIEVEAPEGYILNLDNSSFIINDEEGGNPRTVAAGNFINYQGSVILTKTDASGIPLEGAVFELKLDGEKKGEWTTDEKGKIFIDELRPGKYTLVEIKSPEGYILDQTIYAFVVAPEEKGEPSTIYAGNAKNHKGTMEFIKTDETGMVLEGAHFEIRDEENNLVERAVSDVEGMVKAENLAPGKYSVNEIEAPAGYIINTETLDFAIEGLSMGKPEKIDLGVFVNYRGVLRIEKVDGKGNPLADAEFKLLDVEGKTYREKLVSDESGKIMISGIAEGKYTLVEVRAPKGYFESDEVYPFEIAASHEGRPSEILIRVINEELPEEESVESLPNAGDADTGFLFTLMGLLFITGGLTFLNKHKKRRIV